MARPASGDKYPAVGCRLKALRAAKVSAALEPFAGFGNPLLTGLDGTDKSAWAKQECGQPAPQEQDRIANVVASVKSLVRDGVVNVEDLRRQPPLAETADELCAVGRELGVPKAGLRNAIHLGQEATVSKVKALSRSGDLARARVVHFATLACRGETAIFARIRPSQRWCSRRPPRRARRITACSPPPGCQLQLNADWVVLSACNTAGGSAESAEALSGLARAFFSTAPALCSSRIGRYSEAAVAITTGTVNAMRVKPELGRAEALRSAEAALIAKGGRFAHPQRLGALRLVGNSGR